jgi:hypothetical protein
MSSPSNLSAAVLASFVLSATVALHSPSWAQNVTSPAHTWSGTWNFSPASRDQIRNQQADTIARAEGGFYDSFGPASSVSTNSTINHNNVRTVNDSSTGAVNIDAGKGSVIEVDNQLADRIGQQTNTTGATNSSTTTIDVSGSGNSVTAINQADNEGCLDGSITNATQSGQSGGASIDNLENSGMQLSSGAETCNR